MARKRGLWDLLQGLFDVWGLWEIVRKWGRHKDEGRLSKTHDDNPE